ncbi:hypothetical protein Noc_1377 [Nitrosococcus oceani ATCC 19707]|uniref:Uncharacterized protein n=2 Tax=Nitrosococcus oceani TaxID=1229 RepID=Q3JBC5_NITOC|nr:hypothetical protein [Nitrosococcus oceani]ABA57871.1 hypothetical protein Noc_1377 [Nitrosococcus oceani ATCC 19707]GEM19511.1 hypothetical protein NONS58_09000 [Nitrosococcus oceani]
MPKNNYRYYVQDLHIIDSESTPPRQVYIREILDSTSAEFRMCKLSAEERLNIIAELGLDHLTRILHECYKSKGVESMPSYNAEQDSGFAFLNLRKTAGEIDQHEYAHLLKALIGMPSPSSSLRRDQ